MEESKAGFETITPRALNFGVGDGSEDQPSALMSQVGQHFLREGKPIPQKQLLPGLDEEDTNAGHYNTSACNDQPPTKKEKSGRGKGRRRRRPRKSTGLSSPIKYRGMKIGRSNWLMSPNASRQMFGLI